MSVPTLFRPIAIFASVSALIQSTVWIVLTIIGLLAYSCVLNIPEGSGTSADQFRVFLVNLYFKGDDCKSFPKLPSGAEVPHNMGQLLPVKVHRWMIAFLCFSIIQFVLSALLLIFTGYTKKPVIRSVVLGLWCLFSLGLVIMDVWLTALFGQDISDIKSYANSVNSDYQPAVGPAILMMCIAARGFVLWILNIILLVYLVTCWVKMIQFKPKKQPESKNDQTVIHAYDNPDAKNIRSSERTNSLELYKDTRKPPSESSEQESDDFSEEDFRMPETAYIPPPMPVPVPVPTRQRVQTPEPPVRSPQREFPPQQVHAADIHSPRSEAFQEDDRPQMLFNQNIVEAKKSLRKVGEKPRPALMGDDSDDEGGNRSSNLWSNIRLFEQGQQPRQPQRPVLKQPVFQPPQPISPPPRAPEKKYGRPILISSSPVVKRKVLADDNNFY